MNFHTTQIVQIFRGSRIYTETSTGRLNCRR